MPWFRLTKSPPAASNRALVIASLGIQPPEDDCFCAAATRMGGTRTDFFSGFGAAILFLAQRFEIQVRNHVADDVAIDCFALQGACQRHGVETQVIDVARNAFAVIGDEFASADRQERGLLAARNPQAMVNVGVHFMGCERLDANHHGNALPELRHGWTGQAIGELGLTGQHDLHQFCPGSFEIGEQADGLEDFLVQILRFVNHQHEAPARAHLLGEQAVQDVVHGRQIHARDVNAEIHHDVANELARIAIGAKHKGGASLVTQVGKIMVEQGSLAHSRLGDQRQESTIAFRAVDERGERLPVLRSQIQEP